MYRIETLRPCSASRNFYWKMGKFSEIDSADTRAGKFPLVLMGGWAEGPACADTGARTPIGASGIEHLYQILPVFLYYPSPPLPFLQIRREWNAKIVIRLLSQKLRSAIFLFLGGEWWGGGRFQTDFVGGHRTQVAQFVHFYGIPGVLHSLY